MNICQAGHTKHDTLTVDTTVDGIDLKLSVYDWEKYQGFNGYCTGQDDISRTLLNTGVWEPVETALALEILRQPDEGILLDFGSQIGWFTLLAAKLGRFAWSVEGDTENLDMLEVNANFNRCIDKIMTNHMWIDKDSSKINIEAPVQLMKCDLEGNDIHAVKICSRLFEKRLIKYALVEVSPCFNDTYPDLVEYITSCGYKAYFAEGELSNLKTFDGKYDFDQTNLLFVRGDVL